MGRSSRETIGLASCSQFSLNSQFLYLRVILQKRSFSEESPPFLSNLCLGVPSKVSLAGKFPTSYQVANFGGWIGVERRFVVVWAPRWASNNRKGFSG